MSTDTRIYVNSGIKFDPLSPRPALIQLTDVAQGLSNVCRFSGQCSPFYSVAQHSLLVCALLANVDSRLFQTRVGQLVALFHDAAEAYLGDVPTPLKRHPAWAAYREYENQMLEVIEQKYILDEGFSRDEVEYARESVKRADTLAFVFEARFFFGLDFTNMLMPGETLPDRDEFSPWSPSMSKRRWLEHHAAVLYK